MMHTLSSSGANNDEETPESRLAPPPEQLLITRHDRFSLAHEIERHIEFVLETEQGPRSRALPRVFVDHYLNYRRSVLPRVATVATAPLVLPNGEILAKQGLDRARNTVFRIDPALIELLPHPRDCTQDAVAKALAFLTTDWLCDVSAKIIDKCVLLSSALTVIERALLPERPAFFVSGGRRGAGKTTAITIVILAATGKKPPAAAWSTNEEERRKALLAYMCEGLAAIVWDNIARGSLISCPAIEKTLTAEYISDRLLGITGLATVWATTIQFFTGNNVGPRGDMVSRQFSARLVADRTDPENRPFRHPDPIGWTLAHRGNIMRSLYTILLGNPQLHDPAPPKTRFKLRHHLIGSAMENAVSVANLSEDGKRVDLDFANLALENEAEDEQTNAIAGALEILRRHWRNEPFYAADVAKRINEPYPGELEAMQALHGYLDSVGHTVMKAVTALAVTWRLKAICDAPVIHGAKTLTLTRKHLGDRLSDRYEIVER
jgi:hypothetical protein